MLLSFFFPISQSISSPSYPSAGWMLCAFSACFLLIFSLSGASLLFPFISASVVCQHFSFLTPTLPSHPVARSPKNMCALAQLLLGCQCFWALGLFPFNNGRGGFEAHKWVWRSRVFCCNSQYQLFQFHPFQQEYIGAWNKALVLKLVFSDLGKNGWCVSGLACHKLVDYDFFLLLYYGMETFRTLYHSLDFSMPKAAYTCQEAYRSFPFFFFFSFFPSVKCRK